MYHSLLYSAAEGIAAITLNRPEKRNALNAEIISEIKQAVSQAENDASVRVILLRGAGKDFCSGADLAGLDRVRNASVLDNVADARHMADLFLQLRACPKPVIAAVQGRALAGGCGLATGCDIVLAATSAQLGYPEVNIGFIPAMVMAILRRSVSEKAAYELVVTGEVISAARAHELGVIQRVFPDATFEPDVAAYAARLAAKSASALALSKGLLYQMDAMPFDKSLEAGVQANAIARLTDDCKRGIERFLKKNA